MKLAFLRETRSILARSSIILAAAFLPFVKQAAAQLPVTDNLAPPYLGVFKESFGSQQGIVNDNFFASWLGRTTLYPLVFNGEYTWTEMGGNLSYVNAWARWLAQHPDSKIIVSHAMLPGAGYVRAKDTLTANPDDRVSHARGARGDYDTYFRELATKIRDVGLCDQIIIRLGWEFNGNWYPWGIIPGSPEDDAVHFAANFAHISQTMRSVAATSTTDPGKMPSQLKFCWCGVRQWNSYNIASSYPKDIAEATTTTGVHYLAHPGNDFVHYVGVDVYDTSTWSTILGTATSTSHNGIARWQKFANDNGKFMCFPEWGLSTTSGTGNFDNPAFIQNMFNYCHNPANNVAFQCYFDVAAASNHRLSQGPGDAATAHPIASEKYRQLFTPPLPDRTNIGTISAATKADGLNVIGAGAGFTGTADNFYYTSRAAATEDMFVTKLTSASVAAGQAGVMVRQNTSANAVNAALLISNGNLTFQTRTLVGGTTGSSNVATGVTFPIWLKLLRRGTSITAYRSADGLNWTYAAGQTLSNLSGAATVGVAVSSGSSSILNTVGVDSVDQPDLKLGSETSIASKIIKDNADATGVTFAGSWTAATALGNRYGADYRSIATSAGAASVTFNPGLTAPGLYAVYAHWPTERTLTFNAPLTVNHTGGSQVLTANQEAGWDLWGYAGTYQLNSSSSVVISNGSGGSTTVADAVMFVPVPAPSGTTINFNNYVISPYSNQDGNHSVAIQDAGATLFLTGNTWKRIDFPYTVTPNTVLEFDFKSTSQGEIHGIGLDSDNGYEPGTSGNMFTLYGTDTATGRQAYHNYSGTNWVHYTIPVGSYYTGSRIYLFFVNDKDVGSTTNTSYFRNVTIHE